MLNHSSQLVANRMKRTEKKMLWENLGGVAKEMFLIKDRECVDESNRSQLTEISIVKTCTLNKWLMLKFSSAKSVVAYLGKEFTRLMLYCNADIFNCLGQDACIVPDVALACSSCEAIVEGFYSA